MLWGRRQEDCRGSLASLGSARGLVCQHRFLGFGHQTVVGCDKVSLLLAAVRVCLCLLAPSFSQIFQYVNFKRKGKELLDTLESRQVTGEPTTKGHSSLLSVYLRNGPRMQKNLHRGPRKPKGGRKLRESLGSGLSKTGDWLLRFSQAVFMGQTLIYSVPWHWETSSSRYFV